MSLPIKPIEVINGNRNLRGISTISEPRSAIRTAQGSEPSKPSLLPERRAADASAGRHSDIRELPKTRQLAALRETPEDKDGSACVSVTPESYDAALYGPGRITEVPAITAFNRFPFDEIQDLMHPGDEGDCVICYDPVYLKQYEPELPSAVDCFRAAALNAGYALCSLALSGKKVVRQIWQHWSVKLGIDVVIFVVSMGTLWLLVCACLIGGK